MLAACGWDKRRPPRGFCQGPCRRRPRCALFHLRGFGHARAALCRSGRVRPQPGRSGCRGRKPEAADHGVGLSAHGTGRQRTGPVRTLLVYCANGILLSSRSPPHANANRTRNGTIDGRAFFHPVCPEARRAQGVSPQGALCGDGLPVRRSSPTSSVSLGLSPTGRAAARNRSPNLLHPCACRTTMNPSNRFARNTRAAGMLTGLGPRYE